jgi:CubicO group peptidase (beta-lactamase class C family)
MRKPNSAAWLAAISLAAAPAAQAQVQSLKPAFEAQLQQHGIVGGGLAFVHGPAPATLILEGDARTDPRQPVDAETAYNWASITKTFTAIAVLQLRDRGLLSLNDPITKYVPELRQVHDPFGSPDAVTIRQLLTHSAGFRNPTWPWDCDDPADCSWQPFEPTKWSQVAAMLPYTRIAFQPGSRWSYSNPGYVFLGQVIERLSGDDFEVYVDKNILRPLGMADSYFDRAPYFLQGHVSASYLRAGPRLEAQPFDYDTGTTTSNSGLKAPLTDMVKYLRFLIGEPGNARYETVLKRSSLEEMWRGEIAVAEPGQPATAYTDATNGKPPMMGLGFFVTERGGRRYIYHDGDQAGFSSELMIDPEGRSASLLVVNTTDTGPQTPTATHAISNTDPDPATDLRKALRAALIGEVFPAYAKAR